MKGDRIWFGNRPAKWWHLLRWWRYWRDSRVVVSVSGNTVTLNKPVNVSNGTSVTVTPRLE